MSIKKLAAVTMSALALFASAAFSQNYYLDIRLSGSNVTTVGGVPAVPAGAPVTMAVTAMKRGNPNSEYTTGAPDTPLQVEYSLLSDPTAKMYRAIDPLPSNPLTHDPNLATGSRYSKTYTVYFTKAGDEVILAAGIVSGGDDQLVFLGTLALIVRGGAPDKVVFLQPIPLSQQDAVPPTISGTYDVEVAVTDKWDNPVDKAVPVTVVSSASNIGDVQGPTAVIDPATGNAWFTAQVTNGSHNDIFDLIASISYPGASKASDTTRLRVGRAVDALRVMYRSTPGNAPGAWYKDDEILWEDATVGDWRQVWVIAIPLYI